MNQLYRCDKCDREFIIVNGHDEDNLLAKVTERIYCPYCGEFEHTYFIKET